MPRASRARNEATALAFGQRVRSLRTESGLTQEALAERSGLHATFISNLERGYSAQRLTHCFRSRRRLMSSPGNWSMTSREGPRDNERQFGALASVVEVHLVELTIEIGDGPHRGRHSIEVDPPADSPTGATPIYLFVDDDGIVPVHEPDDVPAGVDIEESHTLPSSTWVYELVEPVDDAAIPEYKLFGSRAS